MKPVLQFSLMLLSASIGTAAFASSLPAKIKTPAEPAAKANLDWEGFYASALIGKSFGHKTGDDGFVYYSDWTSETGGDYLDSNGDSDNANGFSGSLKFGYNKQFGTELVGLEVGGTLQRFQFHSLALRDYYTPIWDYYDSDIPIDGRLNLNSYQTISARIGHVIDDRTLVYISGGLAIGQFSYELTNLNHKTEVVDPTHPSTDRVNAFGYVIGAGIEHRLDKNWSLRLNYENVNFNNVSFHYEYLRPDIVERMGQGILSTFTNSENISNVSVGLTYKF